MARLKIKIVSYFYLLRNRNVFLKIVERVTLKLMLCFIRRFLLVSFLIQIDDLKPRITIQQRIVITCRLLFNSKNITKAKHYCGYRRDRNSVIFLN